MTLLSTRMYQPLLSPPYIVNYDTDTLLYNFNSIWHSDAIWWHTSGSSLAQVMACHLIAPYSNMNQCWLFTKWSLMTLTQDQFHMKCSRYQFIRWVYKVLPHISWIHEVTRHNVCDNQVCCYNHISHSQNCVAMASSTNHTFEGHVTHINTKADIAHCLVVAQLGMIPQSFSWLSKFHNVNQRYCCWS